MKIFRRWEKFQGKPNDPRRRTPHVTINQKGTILMNRIAFEMAGAPSQVSLLFDKQHGVIGLQSARTSEPNTFPVRERSGHNNRIINANPFCRHYEINVGRTMAFNKLDVEDGILLLDLNTLTSAKRRTSTIDDV